MPPPAGRRKRPQDGISRVQKVVAVELGFWLRPRSFGDTWIYMGGRSTSVELQGAHEAGGAPTPLGAPPPSWAPSGSTDILLPPIYTYVPRNQPGAPRNPISTAATFCTHEIPSWGLFRRSAGGGFNHGGLLHNKKKTLP